LELDLYLKELLWLEEFHSDPVRKRELRAEYCAFSGETEKGRALLREEESLPEPAFGPYSFAWLYAALGDVDDCFRWLEKMYETEPLPFHALRLDPLFEPVRRDPRFQVLLKKANLA